MKRTGKVFLGVVLLVVLLVAGAIYYAAVNLDSIVARLIEEKGSEATQTEVRVGGVDIDLRGGTGRVASLRVANPTQFSNEPAISFREFLIRMDPMAVRADPIVIGEISVDGAEILLEQTAAGNNLRVLQEALVSQSTEGDAESPGPEVIIERFTLGESRVQVRVPQLNESREVTIPRMVVSDIGRASNGATASEVARQVLEPVIHRALESGAAAAIENKAKEKVDETKDRVLDRLRDRLEPDDDETTNNP
jgi:uncharacterized protein involved in outer membrane biogenesis